MKFVLTRSSNADSAVTRGVPTTDVGGSRADDAAGVRVRDAGRGDINVAGEQAGELADVTDGLRAVRRHSMGPSAIAALPLFAMVMAAATGFLKWEAESIRYAQVAATDSVQAATDATIMMLSYRADTVDHDLGAALPRMTGSFRDNYSKLISTVVIPGAKQKGISAVAKVPAASSVSASANRAVVMVFVNQTVTVGSGAPNDMASAVKVTLDRDMGQWLISGFDPI